MRTKIKSSVFRQKRKKFCNALTFTKWWLLLEIIFNGSSGEPQSRTLACSFVIKIFASDLFLQIYSRGNFCSFFVLFVPLFSPYFCSTGFVFFFNVLHWFWYIFSFKVSHRDCLLFRFISDTDRSMLFCYIDVFFRWVFTYICCWCHQSSPRGSFHLAAQRL